MSDNATCPLCGLLNHQPHMCPRTTAGQQLDAERAAFQLGIEHGQRFEREAIVAWLRADGGDVCNAYADEIERGEHLRGDDE